MKLKTKKVVFTIKLEQKHVDMLKAISDFEGRFQGQVIGYLLETRYNYLKNHIDHFNEYEVKIDSLNEMIDNYTNDMILNAVLRALLITNHGDIYDNEFMNTLTKVLQDKKKLLKKELK